MAIEQETLLRALFRHRTRLVAYLWSIVHDQHLAEDLYQEVSLLALKKCDEIDDEEHLPKWLRQTARYEALNSLRRKKTIPVAFGGQTLDLLDLHWDQCFLVQSNDADERIAALEECLEKLTPYSRQLIELRYGEKISGEALAAKLGRKTNTVYMALSRVHKSLRECIERVLGAEGGHSHG